jgi:hypothetical protein
VPDSPTTRATAPATDRDLTRGEVGLGTGTEAALLVVEAGASRGREADCR